MKIEKKVWPEYFEDIKSGKKKFELRQADFKIKPGDTLVLREWDPKTKEYTGKEVSKKAEYVLKTKGQKFYLKKEIDRFGYQVIQFK